MRQSALLLAAAAAFVVTATKPSSALPMIDRGVVDAQAAAASGVQKAYYVWPYGYYRPYAYYYYRPYAYYGYYPYYGYYVPYGCYAPACGYYYVW